MHKQISDAELWDSLLLGDEKAFAQIYELHITDLLSYGYRVTNDRQLIKDSIHSLFLHIWEHRSSLSSTDNIKYYLFRALRNRIVDRKKKTGESLTDDFEELVSQVIFEVPVEQLMIEDESSSRKIAYVRNAIRSLPPRQQEIVQLRYFHNLPTDEIAELLKINNQSVRNLLHRSLSQLRNFFERLPDNWIALVAAVFFI